jgi:hypothetical protein
VLRRYRAPPHFSTHTHARLCGATTPSAARISCGHPPLTQRGRRRGAARCGAVRLRAPEHARPHHGAAGLRVRRAAGRPGLRHLAAPRAAAARVLRAPRPRPELWHAAEAGAGRRRRRRRWPRRRHERGAGGLRGVERPAPPRELRLERAPHRAPAAAQAAPPRLGVEQQQQQQQQHAAAAGRCAGSGGGPANGACISPHPRNARQRAF